MELGETFSEDVKTLKDKVTDGRLLEALLLVETELVPAIATLEDIETDLSVAIKIAEDFTLEDRIAINHKSLQLFKMYRMSLQGL